MYIVCTNRYIIFQKFILCKKEVANMGLFVHTYVQISGYL